MLFVAEKTEVQEDERTRQGHISYQRLDLNPGLTLKLLCCTFLALKESLSWEDKHTKCVSLGFPMSNP